MKNMLFAFVAMLLFCQCKDQSTKSENLSIRVSPSTAKAYQDLLAKEKELRPIARLCQESKGYKMDEWDALNECSWAVEKHQMGLHPNIANRSGGVLMFELNDSIYALTHKADEYYQFVDYLPNSKHLVIRVLRPLACPEYWLFNKTNEQKKVLLGKPIFSSNGDSFLVTTSSRNPKIKCSKSISYWALRKGEFQQVTSLQNKTGIHQLIWDSDRTWIGKQNDKFVKIEL